MPIEHAAALLVFTLCAAGDGPALAGATHGLPPLVRAAIDGDVAAAGALLGQGVDVESKDDSRYGDHRTALHVAAGSGDKYMTALLLGSGAQVAAQSAEGWSPLHWVSRYGLSTNEGHLNVTAALLSAGAPVGLRDNSNLTALEVAVKRGNHAVVELLLDHGAPIDTRDSAGGAPLHWAAEYGHSTVVHLLLARGAQVGSLDNTGRTPLYSAVSSGIENVTDLLCRRNAPLATQDHEYGWTPLHWATTRAYPGMVELLLHHGADIDGPSVAGGYFGESGRTPVYWASTSGELDMAQLLLFSGAAVDSRSDAGWTELHWAAREGNVRLARLVLHYGAEVDARDDQDRAPLHLAVASGHVQMARLLLDYNATVDPASSTNTTPLHLAVGRKQQNMVELLLQGGHQLDPRDVNDTTPMHVATVLDVKVIAGLLLQHGADVNGRTAASGWSHLHYSAYRYRLAMATLLLDSGAEVDIRDNHERTPLQLAARRNLPPMVDLLTQYNASVDAGAYMAGAGHERVIHFFQTGLKWNWLAGLERITHPDREEEVPWHGRSV